VNFFIYLREHVEDLVANRLDMSIRFGNLPDSSLVVRNIRPNHRVLVAARAYLNDRGTPPLLQI
jgi:DNA-binding transcriptional LysR family regulator